MQYKDTTKRSLSPAQASGEDPFEADQPAKDARLPSGGGALPPPPNNSAEDTQAEEPASGSGSKRKRLSKTNKKQTYAQRQTSIDAGSVISGIIEEKEEIQSCVSGNSPVVNTVRHSH